MVSSYPKIHAIGHAQIPTLLQGRVIVQEKLDGSQFSFMRDNKGELHFRSRNREVCVNNVDKMFNNGIEAITEIADLLEVGAVYRGEYFQNPRQNAIAYGRVPNHHVMIFDIEMNDGTSNYYDVSEVSRLCAIAGFEQVPLYYDGELGKDAVDFLKQFIDRESVLGNAIVEGVVIKNYAQFKNDGKVVMGKLVRSDFQEINNKRQRKLKPAQKDIVEDIAAMLRREARWAKAVQHLRDDGKLTQTPKDIGPLLNEVMRDIEEECEDIIKDKLFKHFWKQIRGKTTNGLPEWYKQQLAEAAQEAHAEACS